MATYIALFRGINVGGNNILRMKDLVEILQHLGCENVRTYIQSGNVVFQLKKSQLKKIAERIRLEVLESHGFEPKVYLLEKAQLEKAV